MNLLELFKELTRNEKIDFINQLLEEMFNNNIFIKNGRKYYLLFEEMDDVIEQKTSSEKDYLISFSNITELKEIALKIINFDYSSKKFTFDNLLIMKEELKELNKMYNKFKNFCSVVPELIIVDKNSEKVIQIKD